VGLTKTPRSEFFQHTMKNYFLPEKSRPEMQKIWGKEIFGTEIEIKRNYEEILSKKKYKLVITVGDYCSHHLDSDIKIFDKKVQRKIFAQKHECALTIKNPAGTIQKEAWEAIKSAIKDKTNLCVEGEEDLLVIPAVLLAKPKTLIVYGFPNKGICLIEANLKNKTVFRLALKKYFKTANC
jgi:GTP-dependent dephospho-CoA kinase